MGEKNYHKERDEIEIGLVSGLLGMETNGSLHHGVLPHEDDRIATQTLSNVLQLVRSDVVSCRDQDLTVQI